MAADGPDRDHQTASAKALALIDTHPAGAFHEVEMEELAPRPGKGRHRHLFEIRGLVLSGTFIVTQTSEPVTYLPGQIFAVAHGELHDESIGPDGARLLVGRKFSGAGPSASL